MGIASKFKIRLFKEKDDKELSITEHLTELRSRLIRCIVYICLGMVIGWIVSNDVYRILSSPVIPYLSKYESSFITTDILEGFMIKLQMALLVGVAIAIPMLTLEGWGFIAPGLTKNERKSVWIVAPLSICLFATGVLLAYKILPGGIGWLISQNFSGVKFMPKVQQTILFVLKMCIAFGIVFQMPVVMMFLAKIGIVDSKMLKMYWKHALVILALISAMVTPSTDAFTMLMMCLPLAGLYGISILLVLLVERAERRK